MTTMKEEEEEEEGHLVWWIGCLTLQTVVALRVVLEAAVQALRQDPQALALPVAAGPAVPLLGLLCVPLPPPLLRLALAPLAPAGAMANLRQHFLLLLRRLQRRRPRASRHFSPKRSHIRISLRRPLWLPHQRTWRQSTRASCSVS